MPNMETFDPAIETDDMGYPTKDWVLRAMGTYGLEELTEARGRYERDMPDGRRMVAVGRLPVLITMTRGEHLEMGGPAMFLMSALHAANPEGGVGPLTAEELQNPDAVSITYHDPEVA